MNFLGCNEIMIDNKFIRILVTPGKITQKQKLWNIVKMLDLVLAEEYEPFDICIKYNYSDKSNVLSSAINGSLTDITKWHVDATFSHIFGYSIWVNTDFKGICVRKGNSQCTKDGTILSCPLVPEEGFVYQKLIDARIDLTHIQIIRVPVFRWQKEVIPFVWTVTKHIRWTFKDPKFMYFKKIRCHKVEDLFFSREIRQIFEFCELMGINWAELDVLRDSDGRIYIIDVNNIPGNHAFYMMQFEYVKKYAETFKEVFL
jgi:hypothetical protein